MISVIKSIWIKVLLFFKFNNLEEKVTIVIMTAVFVFQSKSMQAFRDA